MPVFGALSAPLDSLSANCAQLRLMCDTTSPCTWANFGKRWLQSRDSCPTMHDFLPTCANLGPTRPHFGPLSAILWPDFCRRAFDFCPAVALPLLFLLVLLLALPTPQCSADLFSFREILGRRRNHTRIAGKVPDRSTDVPARARLCRHFRSPAPKLLLAKVDVGGTRFRQTPSLEPSDS